MSVVGLENLMNDAWDLVMDELTISIAICGRGGIGKTTLLKQIYNKLARTQHFENLIWVTVSSNSTPAKIQESISKAIGLFDAKWVHSSFPERTQLIRDELSGKKFVLFLDDMWRRVDLIELGVPNFGWHVPNQIVQKLIFTTRSVSMANSMVVHSILEMDELSMEDSRQLFRNKVGDDVLGDTGISELPEILIRRCRGLPLLLCTVGRAMASKKTSSEWLDALVKIRRLEGSDTSINSLLHFCFDSLPNHRIKCCLVYFSLFPEDFTILKNDLIDFWICEHLLDEYDTEDDTLVLGDSAIHTLVGAGLLEEDDDGRVKLLDTIRDFASSVAFEYQMFKNAQLMEADPEEVLNHVGWPSTLMGNFQADLPNISQDLFAFLLNHNPFIMLKHPLPQHAEIAHLTSEDESWFDNQSFENLSNFSQFKTNLLTVLDLSYSGVEEVPREISTLVSLQYLNLSHTWIDRLPIELKTLTELKCLNLEYDDQLRIIPRQLISSWSSLQVLKLFRCGYSVEEVGGNILSLRNMDIDPLFCLQHVKVLSITITCASALYKFFNNPNFLSCIQSLSLEIFWNSKSLDISPLAAMNNLLTLEIHQAEALKELNGIPLHSKVASRGSFKRLQNITLTQCSNLRELTWVVLAASLKVLRVESCEKMEDIINTEKLGELLKGGGEEVEPFAKLEILALESLPKLKSIYWKALPFQYLKKIEIVDCLLLRTLPINSDSAKGMVIEAEEDWWNDLEWEDGASRIAFVQCFRQLV